MHRFIIYLFTLIKHFAGMSKIHCFCKIIGHHVSFILNYTKFAKIVTMKTKNYCIITTTIDDENIADQISTALLKDHWVACVQSHTVQSNYHWNGALETSEEILLQMKTKASLFEEIKVQIEALHTYDVPEIIMTSILDANEDYLKWIEEETR